MRRISTGLVLAGLVLVGAAASCKKAGKSGAAGSGSAAASGSGAAGSGSGSGSGKGSGGSGSAASADSPLSGTPLAQHYLSCTDTITVGKLDKLKDCLAEAYINHDAGTGGDLKRDPTVAMFAAMKRAFPDLRLDPQLVLVDGKTVAAIGLMTGTFVADLDTPGGPLRATHEKLAMLWFHRLRYDDTGRAVHEWFIDDATTMMTQLGMSGPGAGGRPRVDQGMAGAPILVAAAHDDKERANLAVFQQAVAAQNAHQVAGLAPILADDVVEADQSAPADVTGARAVIASLQTFLDGFSAGRLDPTEAWAAGDYVIALGAFSGTHDRDAGAVKATGKVVSLPYAEVVQLAEGKITRLWRFRNGADLVMQLGVQAIAPAAPAGSGSAGSGSAGSGGP